MIEHVPKPDGNPLTFNHENVGLEPMLEESRDIIGEVDGRWRRYFGFRIGEFYLVKHYRP